MPIQTRIFLGFALSKEIKIHLNQSHLWKESKNIGESNLIEILWEDKEYIGLFTPPFVSLTELKEIELKVKNFLQQYCTKINLDHHSIYLLSQLFIS